MYILIVIAIVCQVGERYASFIVVEIYETHYFK